MKNARITWDDNNADELGHRIYRSLSPMDTANMPPAHAELGPDVTEWTDTDTPQDVDVYYRVSAYTAAEEAFSDEVLVNTSEEGLPPGTEIGDFVAGGYYIGNIVVADGGADDGEYAIIMGGAASEATLEWKTTRSSTPGPGSNTNGMANTLAMQDNDPATHHAGMYCLEYNGGGFDDWYLPAINELELAWVNRSQLSVLGMASQRYWSSTQFSSQQARWQHLGLGTSGGYYKDTAYGVRPVRRLKI